MYCTTEDRGFYSVYATDFSTQCADRFCRPPNLLHIWYWGLFPGGKAAGT